MTTNNLANLHAKIAGSKALKSNDAAYQTINQLISSLKTEQTRIDNIITTGQAVIDALTKVIIVDIDTSAVAPTITLTDYNFKGFIYVFKDISGNASSNTITFVGTVDGVVGPTITTDYGILRVYLGLIDNLFHEW